MDAVTRSALRSVASRQPVGTTESDPMAGPRSFVGEVRRNKRIQARWRARLAVAVLILPATVPLALAYASLALPCCLLSEAAAKLNRSRKVAGHSARPRSVCRAAADRALKVTALGFDSWWMPFWRLCTRAGRERCAYVDLSRPGGTGEPARCTAAALPPVPTGCCRVVFISDTHGKHQLVDVPAGDVLCHSGDILLGLENRVSPCRTAARLEEFDRWLGTLPHTHKVVIGGNHDAPLERLAARARESGAAPLANAAYLEDSGAALELGPGRALGVWGNPWSAAGSSANQAFRAHATRMKETPEGGVVDVLLSHSALPEHVRDRVRPRVHGSGHFHGGHGARLEPGGALAVNAAVCDTGYRATNPAVVVDLPLPATRYKEQVVPSPYHATAAAFGLSSLKRLWNVL